MGEEMTVRETFDGSSGDATKDLYARLEKLGPIGIIGLNLFRAQKCSTRAKGYRRRAHKADAYDRKNWSMQQLCNALLSHATAFGIQWGWKEDPKAEHHKWVLYVNLPPIIGGLIIDVAGALPASGPSASPGHQVSFHAFARGKGPDYPGEWDHSHASAERIINFCEDLLSEPRTAVCIGFDVASKKSQTVTALFIQTHAGTNLRLL